METVRSVYRSISPAFLLKTLPHLLILYFFMAAFFYTFVKHHSCCRFIMDLPCFPIRAASENSTTAITQEASTVRLPFHSVSMDFRFFLSSLIQFPFFIHKTGPPVPPETQMARTGCFLYFSLFFPLSSDKQLPGNIKQTAG